MQDAIDAGVSSYNLADWVAGLLGEAHCAERVVLADPERNTWRFARIADGEKPSWTRAAIS